MVFTYKKWDDFCRKLSNKGLKSITAESVKEEKEPFLVLKHDVETDVAHALRTAQIERSHGHRGSYYVQAYLLSDERNVRMLQQIQELGHEVSYHYDVMDSCSGDIDLAQKEFETNRQLFESKGFVIRTVCQHGNPVIERVGYTSNRDFFRSERVRVKYPKIADIMVNYKEVYSVDYRYYSDAGREFHYIFDPVNNDLRPSDDKNVAYQDLDALFDSIASLGESSIISIHPHRWTASSLAYTIKAAAFKCIRKTAKMMMKIKPFKKIMSKYYYLAKKI